MKFAASSRVNPVVYLLSAMLSLFLLGFRVWTAGFLGTAGQSSETHKYALVTAGPYAYVRNPMYLAAMLLGLLYVAMSGLWYSIFVWAAGYLYTYFQVILYEEDYLQKTFGEKYEQYRCKVPRMIPSLKAYDDRIGNFKLGSETLRNTLAEMIIMSIFWYLYWWF